MNPVFHAERERQNRLYYKEYINDKGSFRFHSHIELYIVDDGEMEVVVNNHRKILKKDEMYVALSFDPHACKTPEYSKSRVFIIPTYLCEDFVETMQHKRVTSPFVCNGSAVRDIKKYINKINSKNINPISQKGYIYIVLGLVMDNIGFEYANEPMDTQLSSQLLFYINENYKKDITLSSIAAELGYNCSYLSRYFKSGFNIGINRYITMMRLKNALMLMNEKKHTVTYCAFESGFNSMRSFYRIFYDEFGCTPKEYMKKIYEINEPVVIRSKESRTVSDKTATTAE